MSGMDSGDEKRLGVLGWLVVASGAAALWICGAICLMGGLVLAITGLVVSGFGLASVYIAPLTQWLLGEYGIAETFRVLGAGFLVTTVALAQLLIELFGKRRQTWNRRG